MTLVPTEARTTTAPWIRASATYSKCSTDLGSKWDQGETASLATNPAGTFGTLDTVYAFSFLLLEFVVCVSADTTEFFSRLLAAGVGGGC
jgi:hypothetical protein